MPESIFQSADSEQAALDLIDQMMAQGDAPQPGVDAVPEMTPVPQDVAPSPQSVAPSAPMQSDVPKGIAESAGLAAQEVTPQGTLEAVPPRGPTDMFQVLQTLSDASSVNQMKSQAEQRPEEVTAYNPASNTLPAKLPPGATPIHPADMPLAVQALAMGYGSMNEVGMLLDPADRVAYSLSVMNNRALRSDLKAQLIDQVMRDGKIVPEALGREWYEARNINLKPFNPEVQ